MATLIPRLFLIVIVYLASTSGITLVNSSETKPSQPTVYNSSLLPEEEKHDTTVYEHEAANQHHGIRLVSWRWDEYAKLVTFCMIIISAGIFKLAFHHATWLSWLPESCVLIIIGLILGGIIYQGEDAETIETNSSHPFPHFTAFLFFNILLPPIILDAAYSLHNRDFLDNIGSIMVFAIIGTLFNVFIVAYSLYFVNYIGKYCPI